MNSINVKKKVFHILSKFPRIVLCEMLKWHDLKLSFLYFTNQIKKILKVLTCIGRILLKKKLSHIHLVHGQICIKNILLSFLIVNICGNFDKCPTLQYFIWFAILNHENKIQIQSLLLLNPNPLLWLSRRVGTIFEFYIIKNF